MYYLAIDLGASGGRHVLGELRNGFIIFKEIYRFGNSLHNRNGSLCWDLNQLFHEIKTGLRRCRDIRKQPRYVGIDTWAVDFVLLDTHNNILGDTVGYRDSRTKGIDTKVSEIIDESTLYQRTGIQKKLFNSIYQLMAIKASRPEIVESARSFLMIPDYFNFLLTGVKINEDTNATSTQLVHHHTKTWDDTLIDRLGLKREMFGALAEPGTRLEKFTN